MKVTIVNKPVMPQVLALVRHGYSEGQRVAELEKQGDLSAFTPEYRQTSSANWNLVRHGFLQARQAAAWTKLHVTKSKVLPSERFARGFFFNLQVCLVIYDICSGYRNSLLLN